MPFPLINSMTIPLDHLLYTYRFVKRVDLMLSVLLQYLEGLKTEIQLSKSEDQIGFLQQFMNRAPAHLANRKEL